MDRGKGMFFQAISAVLTVLVTSAAAHEQHDEVPRIAIVSAFAPEHALLRTDIEDAVVYRENGVEFTTGSLEGQDLLLFLSGIGVVKASMTVQLALNLFEIEKIVFSGIAGGVNPDLNIGDVMIADRAGQYLETMFARDIDGHRVLSPFFAYPYGNYGMMFPRSVTVQRAGADGIETRFWFPVDQGLLKLAQDAVAAVKLKACTAENVCLQNEPRIVFGGSGVSGSAFVDNADFREDIFATFEAEILDMESAHIAHAAYANAVPFIAVRSVSDLAGGGEGKTR